ncbi:MAG: hypothetical protein LBH59_02490 [Planctomycetaceae bacterium]|jgi:hypothetical protein|nr:hypothetical protein [Planctomycetaceae bacterium]
MSIIKVGLCLGVVIVSCVALFAQSPTPTSPQTKPTKPMVYQGKTFDEWRGSPRIEIDQRCLIETIRAFGAFGRRGYGQEAIQAICDAISEEEFFGVYPVLDVQNYRDYEKATEQAIIEMALIPKKDIMPILLKLLNSNVANDRAFAYHIVFCMGSSYGGRSVSFTPEFLQMLFEKSLQMEKPPVAHITWTNLLGRCDNSGEYVFKYLREMIRKDDDKRFADAFDSIRKRDQSDGWDWKMSEHLIWFPLVYDLDVKSMTVKLSKHGKAIQHFLKEEGLKSKNAKINKISDSLLKALDENVSKQADGYGGGMGGFGGGLYSK